MSMSSCEHYSRIDWIVVQEEAGSSTFTASVAVEGEVFGRECTGSSTVDDGAVEGSMLLWGDCAELDRPGVHGTVSVGESARSKRFIFFSTLTDVSWVMLGGEEHIAYRLDLLSRDDLLRLLQLGLQCLNEDLVIRTGQGLEHLLDDIVAVAILEEAQQVVLASLVLRNHSGYEFATFCVRSTDQATLHDIASKLVLAEHEELVAD